MPVTDTVDDAIPDGADPVKITVSPLDLPVIVPRRVAVEAGHLYEEL